MYKFDFKKEHGEPLKILCLGAHCDDIEIGCGGTLLKFMQEYEVEKVMWTVFASNEVRRDEAITGAEQILSDIKDKEINVLSYRDTVLNNSAIDIKLYFESIKEMINPDVIFTHYRRDRHQDHRLISDLTWNTFRDHLILEYEIPKYDGDLDVPNAYCKLDSTQVDRKIKVLMESYPSQRVKHWFDDESFRSLMRIRGMECATRYAEAFHVRKLLF